MASDERTWELPAHASSAALLVGVATVVLGAFLPWVWSGGTGRSSFAMVRTADRLGIGDGDAGPGALRIWYLVPLVAAAVVVLVTVHRRRAAAIVGLGLSAIVATIAVVVLAVAPTPGSGPLVSITGAAIVLIGAVVTSIDRRRGPPASPASAG